jgi:hypothetical protein
MSTYSLAPANEHSPEAVRAWDKFWFNPTRPTTLGVIRICTGLIVLYVHFLYSFQLSELLGPDAWLTLRVVDAIRHDGPITQLTTDWNPELPQTLPEELKPYADEWGGADRRMNASTGSPWWSVWFHVTDPTGMVVLHALTLLAMAMFTVGFCTRMTSAITWMAALGYIQRSQVTLFGMDTMMNILLIYLMIGPSGAALSVDRLISHWWARRQARKEGRPPPAWEAPVPSMSATFALRLIQVHFCIIYLASGTSKLLGSTWWGGTALWLTLANSDFAPMQYSLYRHFLIWLANHRLIWELFIEGGCVFTLVMEIGLPFLIWVPRLRWLMIIGAVLLHTGIALSMGLTTFGMLMLCMLLAFIPPETFDQLLARIPRPAFMKLA